jgi:chaperonin GroES
MSQHFRKLLPTLNRILVKKAEPIEKTASGLILSQTKSENTAQVVAIGEGNIDQSGIRIPLTVKLGDTVLLPDFGGQKIELKDGEYFLYRDTDVLGVLEN